MYPKHIFPNPLVARQPVSSVAGQLVGFPSWLHDQVGGRVDRSRPLAYDVAPLHHFTLLMELLAPDHTFHHTSGPVDRETHLQGINAFAAAFSDLRFIIEDQIAEGDTVATRLTWRANHSGNFHGQPATQKDIEVSGISIERIDDGKIVERWFIHNELGLMQQIGLVPPP